MEGRDGPIFRVGYSTMFVIRSSSSFENAPPFAVDRHVVIWLVEVLCVRPDRCPHKEQAHEAAKQAHAISPESKTCVCPLPTCRLGKASPPLARGGSYFQIQTTGLSAHQKRTR